MEVEHPCGLSDQQYTRNDFVAVQKLYESTCTKCGEIMGQIPNEWNRPWYYGWRCKKDFRIVICYQCKKSLRRPSECEICHLQFSSRNKLFKHLDLENNNCL